MRPGQNNFKNRNRNRNRRHGGGGNGGGGGGGNSNNRVLDFNGPDVKLRGTAQTIAEKYMQLARDAHSSGDRVMAESYYQHADHYYRVWLAAQPVGQPVNFPRRLDEDVEDLEGGDGEDDGNAEAAQGEQQEGGEGAAAAGEGAAAEGDAGEEGQNRNFRNRDQGGRDQGNREQGNRDQNGNGRERFRNRWPRRNERYPDQPRDGNVAPAPEAQGDDAERAERPDRNERIERPERVERPERSERPPRRERNDAAPVAEASGDWEAPSFLKRPMPAVADEAEGAADVAPAAERRPRARRPRYGEEGVTPNEPPVVNED